MKKESYRLERRREILGKRRKQKAKSQQKTLRNTHKKDYFSTHLLSHYYLFSILFFNQKIFPVQLHVSIVIISDFRNFFLLFLVIVFRFFSIRGPQSTHLPSLQLAGGIFCHPIGVILRSSLYLSEQRAPISVITSRSSPGSPF